MKDVPEWLKQTILGQKRLKRSVGILEKGDNRRFVVGVPPVTICELVRGTPVCNFMESMVIDHNSLLPGNLPPELTEEQFREYDKFTPEELAEIERQLTS